MFIELMPLVAGRTVMITLAREDENTLRVNVIPTTKSGSAENPALTTPLSYMGTAEGLDAELGRQLAGYVECHRALGSTLASAKAEMEAAAKGAREEVRKRLRGAQEKDGQREARPAILAAALGVRAEAVGAGGRSAWASWSSGQHGHHSLPHCFPLEIHDHPAVLTGPILEVHQINLRTPFDFEGKKPYGLRRGAVTGGHDAGRGVRAEATLAGNGAGFLVDP